MATATTKTRVPVSGHRTIAEDPWKRTVRVYTAPDRSVLLREDQTLDGGDVLPGFSLSIRDWFAEAERNAPRE